MREASLERTHQTVGDLAAGRAEKIESEGNGEALAQAPHGGLRLRHGILAALGLVECPGERAGLLRDRLIVGVARGLEHGLELLVGEAVDDARLHQRGLASLRHDRAQEPLKILASVVARG